MIDNRNAGDVYSQAFDKLSRRRLMGKGKTFNKKGYSVENGLTEEKKKKKRKVKSIIYPHCKELGQLGPLS